MQRELEFGVLGPFEIRAEGRPLLLRSPKQRALLALLLLHANEVVSSDRLIEELWLGKPPDSAANVLQVYVSQVRKLVEPERALAGLHEALALWRGPAFAEFAFEDFARTERARLEELRLLAIEERFE